MLLGTEVDLSKEGSLLEGLVISWSELGTEVELSMEGSLLEGLVISWSEQGAVSSCLHPLISLA